MIGEKPEVEQSACGAGDAFVPAISPLRYQLTQGRHTRCCLEKRGKVKEIGLHLTRPGLTYTWHHSYSLHRSRQSGPGIYFISILTALVVSLPKMSITLMTMV